MTVTSSDTARDALPDVLIGPLLRRLAPDRLVLWLMGSRPLALTLMVRPDGVPPRRLALGEERLRHLPLGRHAWLHLIDVSLATPLPTGVSIAYDLKVSDAPGEPGIADWAPHLLHEAETNPTFVLAERHHRLLHGSCRKPHHDGPDGLVRADAWLAERREAPDE